MWARYPCTGHSWRGRASGASAERGREREREKERGRERERDRKQVTSPYLKHKRCPRSRVTFLERDYTCIINSFTRILNPFPGTKNHVLLIHFLVPKKHVLVIHFLVQKKHVLSIHFLYMYCSSISCFKQGLRRVSGDMERGGVPFFACFVSGARNTPV